MPPFTEITTAGAQRSAAGAEQRDTAAPRAALPCSGNY